MSGILFEIPEIGAEVKLHGQGHGKAKVVAHNHLNNTIVIHFKGYGENPGSRYSGLYAYYPAHTVVYQYGPHDHFEAFKLTELVRWETGTTKK